MGLMEKQERRIFSSFPVFLCNVYSLPRGLGRVDQGQASSFKANIFESQRQIFLKIAFKEMLTVRGWVRLRQDIELLQFDCVIVYQKHSLQRDEGQKKVNI